MYRKHIIYFITVSLKHFFNLDLAHFRDAFIIFPVAVCMFKVHLATLGSSLSDGLMTVRQDAVEYKERWVNSSVRRTIAAGVYELKDTLRDRIHLPNRLS